MKEQDFFRNLFMGWGGVERRNISRGCRKPRIPCMKSQSNCLHVHSYLVNMVDSGFWMDGWFLCQVFLTFCETRIPEKFRWNRMTILTLSLSPATTARPFTLWEAEAQGEGRRLLLLLWKWLFKQPGDDMTAVIPWMVFIGARPFKSEHTLSSA